MNKLQRIGLLLLISLYTLSCEKEFVVDFGEEEHQIVVNGLITNTTPLSATITKSFQYQANKTTAELVENIALKDATVAIYENGEYIEDMVYQESPTRDIGAFIASFLPKVGATYQIEAKHEDLITATSAASIPKGVDIMDATVKYGGRNAFPFSFTLNDPAEKNYYYLTMFFKGYVLDSLTQTRIDRGAFIVEIPEGALPTSQRYLNNGYLFKDDGLAGNSVVIAGIAKSGIPILSSLSFGSEIREDLKEILLDTTELYIHLETLSEDAYKFHTSNAVPLQAENIGLLNTTENVYGNVENGLGLFAGVYVSEVGVRVE